MFVDISNTLGTSYPPASKVSREVANLTERKNPHIPIYGVNEFVCLPVTKFDPNYLRTGKTDWAAIFLGHLRQKTMSQKFLCVRKGADRARTEGRNSNIWSSITMFCLKSLC